MPELRVVFDQAQSRVKQKPVYTLADGDSWDGVASSNVMVDPVSGTAFLRPTCYDPSFYASNAPPYDKHALTDFSGYGADWYEHDPSGINASLFLSAPAGNVDTLVTNAALAKNRGVYMGVYVYGDGSNYLVCSCGWTGGPQIDLYSSGRIDVGIGGLRIARGSMGKVRKQEEYDPAGEFDGGDDSQQSVLCEFVILPCRRRELLILCSRGGGFTVTMPGISESDSSPAITPDAPFWIQFGGNATPDFQFAPLKFATSGTLVGLSSAFKRPPVAGASLETYGWGDEPYDGSTTSATTSLTRADGTPFVPDGAVSDCRISVALSGPGTSTPFVYGAMAGYGAVSASTPDIQTDVTRWLTAIELRVPEDPFGVEWSLEFKSIEEMQDSGAPGMRAIGNRPVAIFLGDVRLCGGRLDSPNWSDHLVDAGRRYHAPIRDFFKVIERATFDDAIPFDGMLFHESIEWRLRYLGLAAESWDITETDYRLPSAHSSDWSELAESGEQVGGNLRSAMERYAANWIYGERPYVDGPRLFFLDPSELSSSPVYHLYLSIADAMAAGFSEPDARFHVYDEYTERVVEIEANEGYVTGMDPMDGRPIVHFFRDLDSIDPAQDVSLRPENWYGEVLTAGLIDESLASDADVERAMLLWGPRISRVRRQPSWSCQMMHNSNVPVWRGDLVVLHDALGLGRDQTVRITCFDGSFALDTGIDGDPDQPLYSVRPFHYSGEEEPETV